MKLVIRAYSIGVTGADLNSMRAEALLTMISVLRLGRAELLVSILIDEDSDARITSCFQVLSASWPPPESIVSVVLKESRDAYLNLSGTLKVGGIRRHLFILPAAASAISHHGNSLALPARRFNQPTNSISHSEQQRTERVRGNKRGLWLHFESSQLQSTNATLFWRPVRTLMLKQIKSATDWIESSN